MKIVEYLDYRNRSPFASWFEELDAAAAVKVTVALVRVEQGNLSNVKGIGDGVLEYRIDFGPGYRIYFAERAMGWSSCSGEEPSGVSKMTSNAPRKTGEFTRNEGKGADMPLTRSFKDTIKARAATDTAFRSALLTEAVDLLLSGDVATGKAVLRDYINATVGFEYLAEEVGTPSKSLMRMFSATGNPRADNLFSVISSLQQLTGVHLAVRPASRHPQP